MAGTKTKTVVPDNGQSPSSTEEARQMLMLEKQERTQACKAEVEAVLQRHRCSINPVVIIAGGQIQQQLQFVALE